MFSKGEVIEAYLLIPSGLAQETSTGYFGELDACSPQLEGTADWSLPWIYPGNRVREVSGEGFDNVVWKLAVFGDWYINSKS